MSTFGYKYVIISRYLFSVMVTSVNIIIYTIKIFTGYRTEDAVSGEFNF